MHQRKFHWRYSYWWNWLELCHIVVENTRDRWIDPLEWYGNIIYMYVLKIETIFLPWFLGQCFITSLYKYVFLSTTYGRLLIFCRKCTWIMNVNQFGFIVTRSNLVLTWKVRPQMGIISWIPLGVCWFSRGNCILVMFLQLIFSICAKKTEKRMSTNFILAFVFLI